MQEPTSRGEFGRKTYFLMGHYMPAGTGTPVISVALAAGHGHSGQDGRLELWLGNDCKAPDNEEEGMQSSADLWDFGKSKRHAEKRGEGAAVLICRSAATLPDKTEDTVHAESATTPAEDVDTSRPEPLRAVCFVGFPPPELLNYQSSISIMEGLIAHMTYHDEGLTRSQVYNAYFRSRHMLPKEKDILPLEEANERSESIMYPFHHQQPSPLMWLVISDKWHQVDTVLFAVLNSKTYLQRHGRDKGPQELARSLRMAAIQLLMNIFDLEAVVPHRLRQYALNFSNMKSVTQTPFRLGISEDSFAIDFKLRFRGYALLEEGAKVQSIISCFAKKGSADRDQFRIALEATAVQSSEECMLAGEATGKPQAWHIVFCYNGQPTVLPVPPMAGEWLHCAISYADGHTEMCCSWDGAPARKVEADYSKVDQRVSTDGYIGMEVTKKHIINNLLCDIHYFR
ncbi:RYR1, partial [Symbiodinium necroappetens]